MARASLASTEKNWFYIIIFYKFGYPGVILRIVGQRYRHGGGLETNYVSAPPLICANYIYHLPHIVIGRFVEAHPCFSTDAVVLADEFTQDWELEVAKAYQLPEYIEYYKNEKLNLNEKTTLMRIMLQAYDDFVTDNRRMDIYGEYIKEFLKRDAPIHDSTIKYWSCEDNSDIEDCFAITSFIRKINE